MCNCSNKVLPADSLKNLEVYKSFSKQESFLTHVDERVLFFLKSTDYKECIRIIGNNYIPVRRISTLKFSGGIYAYNLPFVQYRNPRSSKHIVYLYDSNTKKYFWGIVEKTNNNSNYIEGNNDDDILNRTNISNTPIGRPDYASCAWCLLEAGAAPVTGGTSLLGLIFCIRCARSLY
jgi:hypothetical protein